MDPEKVAATRVEGIRPLMDCLVDYGHVSIPLTACPSDLDLILWLIGHNCLTFTSGFRAAYFREFFLGFGRHFLRSNLRVRMLLSPQLPSISRLSE